MTLLDDIWRRAVEGLLDAEERTAAKIHAAAIGATHKRGDDGVLRPMTFSEWRDGVVEAQGIAKFVRIIRDTVAELDAEAAGKVESKP